TRAELDRVAPNHPVSFSTGPDMMLNTAALKLSGIDRNFVVSDGGAGFVEKDANGEPTGLLRGLSRYVKASNPQRRPNNAESYEGLKSLFRDFNRNGLTAVADRGTNESLMEYYEKMLTQGDLTVRVAMSYAIPIIGPMESILADIDRLGAHQLRKENPWLHL